MIMPLEVPPVLCIYDVKYRADTLSFLRDFRFVRYLSPPVLLDFSHTEKITAAAGLLLFSQINQIQLVTQNPDFFQFKIEKSPLFNSLFISFKYLRCLQFGCLINVEPLEREKLPFQSGVKFEDKRKIILQDIRDLEGNLLEVQRYNADEIKQFCALLRTSITEAIVNVENHAYLVDNNVEPRWWYGLWFEPETEEVTFILYDMGVGIVESYLKHSIPPRQPVHSTFAEHNIFQEALREGQSRFVNKGRGNGFSRIAKLSYAMQHSQLLIHSYRHQCLIQNGQMMCFMLPPDDLLRGTLVEINFNLKNRSIYEK